MADGVRPQPEYTSPFGETGDEAPANDGARVTHGDICSPCCGSGGFFSSVFSGGAQPHAKTPATSSSTVTTPPTPLPDPPASHRTQAPIALTAFSNSRHQSQNKSSPFARKQDEPHEPASTTTDTPKTSTTDTSAHEARLTDISTGEVLPIVEEEAQGPPLSSTVVAMFDRRLDETIERIGSRMDKDHETLMQGLGARSRQLDSALASVAELNAMADDVLRLFGVVDQKH
jgi:hypothetical protein